MSRYRLLTGSLCLMAGLCFSDVVLTPDVSLSAADPWCDWSATIAPVNGTATVTRATGAQPSLVLDGETVLSVPTTGWPTTGVARVSLSLWAGTNSVMMLTNTVDYSSTPDVSTNGWTRILYTRTGADKWKGVGL